MLDSMTNTQQQIELFKERISNINTAVAEKKAKRDMLSKQLQEQLEELRKLGVSTLEEAVKKIEDYNEKIKTLMSQIEKELGSVETQLGTFEC